MASDHPQLPLGALLRDGYEAVMDFVLGRLATEGFADVRPAHLAIFQQLSPEGSRIGELAARARLTNQSVGYLVDALEALGYVERVDDPDDRRGKLVRLTRHGQDEMAACGRALDDLERRWSDQLGAERFRELRRMLIELRQLPADATEPAARQSEPSS